MKNLLNRYAFEPHTEQKTNSIKKKKVWHDAVTHCKGQGLPVTMTPVAGESTRFEKSCKTSAWDYRSLRHVCGPTMNSYRKFNLNPS